MSDITDSIDYLRDQVAALELELANVQEANSEWHELMNEHDVQYIQTLIRFDENFDVSDVEQVLNNYDLDDLKDAYDKIETHGDPEELAEKVTELEDCERKIEEYGDPEEMAAELEELKEQVESAPPEAPAENPVEFSDIANTLISNSEEIANLKADLAEKNNYIVVLKSEIAQLDANCIRLSDELEKTYGSVPYKALYESLENELSTTKLNLSSLRIAYKVLLHQYFSECSGYDDVPSSKPDFLTDQAVTDVEGDPS